jgi:hypothetical protein
MFPAQQTYGMSTNNGGGKRANVEGRSGHMDAEFPMLPFSFVSV